MRSWMYVNIESGTPSYVVVNESWIIDTYYVNWVNMMYEAGYGDADINVEDCVNDWVRIHDAVEVI